MRICDICGRKPLKGNLRSHSKRATIRRQYLNLQTKIIEGMRVKICANCLKTLVKKPKK